LVYFLSTLEVLGFTKTAGTASGPADDEPIDQLNLHKLIKLIKPHLCQKMCGALPPSLPPHPRNCARHTISQREP